ncbi:MAG TPA: glycine betaine ABC transporter substrate-binding protein [Blastocatellia bacterium]|nr:glycine betaine ABC transporter substrate-binding protein [Blastocatellia bacterium]
MKLIDYLVQNRSEVLQLTLEHLFLVLVATGSASLIGIPVGIILTRRTSLAKPVLAIANVLQTIPSLALFGFLIPVLGPYGIGRVPAIIALFLYSLLPIIRNTFTGVNGVDPAVREAARGMGMTDWQMLTQVELPLALNVIVAGVRVATVISVGTATIAAAIGAGGLGTYIFRGLRTVDRTLILAGAVPAAAMALLADLALGSLERILSPGSGGTIINRRRWVVGLGALVIIAGLVAYFNVGVATSGARIVVGSKDFTESRILSEIVAQTIENGTDIKVEQATELSGDLCHRELVAGQIDMYVEYTGTAFTAILKHPPISDPRTVYDQVKTDYASLFKLEWLQPLGFNNTFAILVRGDDARRLGLKNISDAARYAVNWRAGFGQDFMSRKDGYPGFVQTYGLRFSEPPREMDLSLSYQALANHQVDLIAGNSTDGLIEKLGLVQLEDDRHYFPPYEAAPIIRRDTLDRYPQVGDAVNRLAGRITNEEMRKLNYAVDAEKRDVKVVVNEFLSK